MAPKKEQLKKDPQKSEAQAWEGPLIYLEVSVDSSSPLFPQPKPAEEGAQTPPNLPAQVKVGFAGAPAHGFQSSMVEAAEDGTYAFALSHRVAHPFNHESLETFLNTPVTLTVTTQVLEGKKLETIEVAKAQVDLLPFGLGEHTVENPSLPLKKLETPQTVTMIDAPTVSVRARLLKEVQVEARKNQGAEPAEPEGPTTELKETPILTQEEARDGRVVTMEVSLDGKMPDGLAASAASAGPEMSFRFGMWVPSTPARKLADLHPDEDIPPPRTLLLSKGSYVPEVPDERPASIKFSDSGRRFYLNPTVMTAWTEALEDRTPLLLELARAMPAAPGTLVDNAVDMFHSITRIDMSRLVDPGENTNTSSVRFKKSFGETLAAGRVRKSMLGPLGPAEVNAKGKVLVEGLEMPPPFGSEPRPSAWAAAETEISVSLTLTKPIFPAWSPPPKPANTLEQLVPKRNLEKIVEPREASDDFRAEIRKAAKALAADYHELFGKELAESAGLYAEEKVMATRQRKLVFELNRTGKYLELKESLRDIIVRLVKEKYRKSGNMGYDEMRDLYNDLYVHLIDNMHRALNDLIAGPKKPAEPQVPDDSKLAHLQALADEYEANFDIKRATQYHQERLIASKRADVWQSYGGFMARIGDIPKAIEAFKEVVTIEPNNLDGLICLASVMWQEGVSTDIQYLEQADTVVQAILEALPNNGPAWALLSLIYADKASGISPFSEEEGDPEVAAADARNARYKAMQLCQAAQAQGIEGIGANFYMQLVLTLLELKLGDCAAKALAMVTAVPRWEKVRVDAALCSSRAALLQGQEDAAIRHARDASRHGSKEDPRPYLLQGEAHFKAARYEESTNAYQAALDMGAATCPLELFLRMGTAFQHQGKLQCALDIYTQGCAARPCASMWLGAGVVSLRMGDLVAADLALTEANILDPHNPLVWGYLALTQLVGGRIAEAEMALKFAFKEEVEEASLVLEIAGCYLGSGMYKAAEDVLRQSIKFADGPQLRMMLGDAMLEQNDMEEAAINYAHVVTTDGHLMVDKADKNAVLCLSQLAKCYLALGNEAAYKEVQAYSAELHREEKWMETATIYPK